MDDELIKSIFVPIGLGIAVGFTMLVIAFTIKKSLTTKEDFRLI
jgi:hypothetical protein